MNLPGLLDLPAPLLNLLDDAFAIARLPALARVIVWGSLAGALSMVLYRRASPQSRLATLRAELRDVQRALVVHEGDFSGLLGLIGHQSRLALRQLGLTLLPALLGGVPLVFLLPWMSNRYAFQAPAAGSPIEVCVEPNGASGSVHWQPQAHAQAAAGCWMLDWPQTDAPARLLDTRDTPLLTVPTLASVDIVHKFTWFNVFSANPAGYLPATAPVDAVVMDLPPWELLPFGPRALRTWEASFLLSLFLTSAFLKVRWRLH